jgi:hypothetical protein
VLSQWISCFGVPAAKVSCSHWKIFNNTIYNVSPSNGSARVSWGSSDSSSTDIEVYNNLWVLANNVAPIVSSGSVCYDQTAACASTAQLISDYNHYDTNDTGTSTSEVHGTTTNINPATYFVSAAGKNFKLSADEGGGLNTNSLLSANSTDLAGMARSTDGTWERGAYEFNTGLVPGPPPSPAIGVFAELLNGAAVK